MSNHDIQQYLRLHALGDTFANTAQKARRFAATTEVPRSQKSVRITTPPAHEAVQMLKDDSSLHQRLDKLGDMIQSLQATSRAVTATKIVFYHLCKQEASATVPYLSFQRGCTGQ